MASAVPDKEEAAKSSLESKGEDQQQDAANEVTSPALPSSASDVSTAHASTEESQPCGQSLCDEKGVKSVTEDTVSSVQPDLATLEPHVAAGSECASKGLDQPGQELPLPQKSEEQVTSDTKEQISSRVAEAKDAMGSKVTEVDVTKETLQSSVGMVMEPREGQMAAAGAEAMMEATDGSFLPIKNEELAKLAAQEEGAGIVPVEQQQERRRYFVRLGSLSDEFRLFAYMHSTDKMRQAWQGMQDTLSQLRCIIELIAAFKQGCSQKFEEGQQKLLGIWLDWSRKSPEENGEASLAGPEEVESLALLLASSMTQQLHETCCGIVSATRGLPSSLQDKVKQALATTEELQASFSLVNCFRDLSSSVLMQSQKMMGAIQEHMEELLDYLKNNIPLSWVVGPFSPREEEEETSDEEETSPETTASEEDEPSQEEAEAEQK